MKSFLLWTIQTLLFANTWLSRCHPCQCQLHHPCRPNQSHAFLTHPRRCTRNVHCGIGGTWIARRSLSRVPIQKYAGMYRPFSLAKGLLLQIPHGGDQKNSHCSGNGDDDDDENEDEDTGENMHEYEELENYTDNDENENLEDDDESMISKNEPNPVENEDFSDNDNSANQEQHESGSVTDEFKDLNGGGKNHYQNEDFDITPFDDVNDDDLKPDAQGEYEESNNVDIIPFDDLDDLETDARNEYDESNNVEIIPFDDVDHDDLEPDARNEYDESNNVEIIPFDDVDHDDLEPDAKNEYEESNNVEIIPFDDVDDPGIDTQGEYEESNNVETIALNNDNGDDDDQLFDEPRDSLDENNPVDVAKIHENDDEKIENNEGMIIQSEIINIDNNCDGDDKERYTADIRGELEGGGISDSENKKIDSNHQSLHDEQDDNFSTITTQSIHIQEEEKRKNDEGETKTSDSDRNEFNDIHAAPDGSSVDLAPSETEEERDQVSDPLSLRTRILDLIQIWKHQDSQESSSSIKHLIHERAEEYIRELFDFETNYKFSIAQNMTLPSLQKAAPHPKTFLRYVAPKIQTIKASPQIMLQISSAQPGDASVSACAIGMVSCLIDLYAIILEDLNVLSGEKRGSLDTAKTKEDIIADRRFEQLLECAACGVDIKQRIIQYLEQKDRVGQVPNEMIHSHIDEGVQHIDRINEVNDEDLGETAHIRDSQQMLCLSVSDISKVVLALNALGLENDASIGSHNVTSFMVAITMRSTEILLDEYEKRIDNATERKSLASDIVEIIRVYFLTRNSFGLNIESSINCLLEVLGREITTKNIKSDTEIDSIVDRLAKSEMDPIYEGEDTNTTQNFISVNKTSPNIDSLNVTNKIPSRLIDYLSRRQQMSILKCFTDAIELKEPSRKVVVYLLQKLIYQAERDAENLIEIKEDATETSRIHFDLVDAAKILTSDNCNTNGVADTGTVAARADVDTLPFDRNESSVSAVGWQSVPESVRRGLSGIKQGKSHHNKDHVDLVSRVKTKVLTDDVFDTTIQDCSVIVKVASSIDVKLALSALAPCLKVTEYLGIGTLEDYDINNLIHGIATIASSSQIDPAAAKVIEMIVLQAMERGNGESLPLRSALLLLESVATLHSTQSSPVMNGLIHRNSALVHSFLNDTSQRIKKSSTMNLCELANFAYTLIEFNTAHSLDESSWEDYELFGSIAASMTSVLRKEHLFNTGGEFSSKGGQEETFQIDGGEWNQSVLCRLAFGISLLNLDSDELNQAILYHFQENPEFLSRCSFLDIIRLLYSIAKSRQRSESMMSPITESVVKDCVALVSKEAKDQLLSPQNLGLMLWALGKLCGEEFASLYSTNFPVYAREEVNSLSTTMSLRLITGIVEGFGERIQTDSKIQLLLKNIILHLDTKVENMTSKDLCNVGQLLSNLSAMCLCFEEDIVDIIPESGRDFVVDGEESEDEQEIVISSLFPSTNRRDMLQLCDTVLNRIIFHSQLRIKSFTPQEMKDLLCIIDFDKSRYQKVCESVRDEIAKRRRLVKKQLSIPSQTQEVGVSAFSSGDDNRSETHRSPLRNLFFKERINDQNDDTVEEKILDETTVGLELLRSSLDGEAFDRMLLKGVLEAAYDMGKCCRRTGGFEEREHSIERHILSYIYP